MRTILAIAVLLALTACSSAGADDHGASPRVIDAPTAVELLGDQDDVVIIDVRTPEEYADGRLDGAQLIDIQGGDFAERIAALEPDATTVVYCRTGNRSANAVAIMEQQGFSDLYDAGGYAELAEAGASVDG